MKRRPSLPPARPAADAEPAPPETSGAQLSDERKERQKSGLPGSGHLHGESQDREDDQAFRAAQRGNQRPIDPSAGPRGAAPRTKPVKR